MIRYANSSDIPKIVELARQEHAISHWKHLDFCEERVAYTASEFIGSGLRTLILSDSGYLAALLQPMGFTPRLMAYEFAWFATDGCGFDLLDKFERWAKRMGAAGVVIHSFVDDRLGRVLERRNQYRKLGSAYTKEFFE